MFGNSAFQKADQSQERRTAGRFCLTWGPGLLILPLTDFAFQRQFYLSELLNSYEIIDQSAGNRLCGLALLVVVMSAAMGASGGADLTMQHVRPRIL